VTPTSVTQLLILLLFVVPGFVYQAVRISVRGRLPLDIELSTRIVRAIVSSGIFALVYLIGLGEHLIDGAQGQGYGFEHPRVGAAVALLGGILIPAGLALVRLPGWKWVAWIAERLPEVTRYDPTPTAWDKTFQNASQCFIRILTNDGTWVAGYYGSESYSTSYPETQQVFLEQAFAVADDGTIGEMIEGTQGVLVDCSDIQLLQVLDAMVNETEDEDDGSESGPLPGSMEDEPA
jgi:hypothetical protein